MIGEDKDEALERGCSGTSARQAKQLVTTSSRHVTRLASAYFLSSATPFHFSEFLSLTPPDCFLLCQSKTSASTQCSPFRKLSLSVSSPLALILTRTHKNNDRDHVGLANGTADSDQHLPRYFGKTGHVDADPKGIKKAGGGKGNWGAPGDEVDDEAFNLHHARRRSNSFHISPIAFKTKFETIEHEPVLEDQMIEDEEAEHGSHADSKDSDLTSLDQVDSISKDSTESATSESLDEEAKKV